MPLVSVEALPRAEVRLVDITDTEAVLAACDGANVLWLESPTNPLLGIADLPTLCAAARDRGTLCVGDNTFATPLLQRPLDFGADGGVETTLERRARYPAERGIVPDDLLRVSVGCEHVEDLWADLEHALACTAGLRDAGAVRG